MDKVKVRLALAVEEGEGIQRTARFFYKDVTLARVPVAGDRIRFVKDNDPWEVDHVNLLPNPAFGFFGTTADVEVWFRKVGGWFMHDDENVLDKTVIGEWKWRECK